MNTEGNSSICSVCYRTFCCASCRDVHEKKHHDIGIDCHLCRGQYFIYKRAQTYVKDLIDHISEKHLPLQCVKCRNFINDTADFFNLDRCCKVEKTEPTEEQTMSREDEVVYEGEDRKDTVPVQNATIVIPEPLLRKNSINRISFFKSSPTRKHGGELTLPLEGKSSVATSTPTLTHLKENKIVMTSTPMNQVNSGWNLFKEEETESPIGHESSKKETTADNNTVANSTGLEIAKENIEINRTHNPKSILMSSRFDASATTSRDYTMNMSNKIKKVTFAKNTVFSAEGRQGRMTPTRPLTPGIGVVDLIRKRSRCQEPIYHFGNQSAALSRTPKTSYEQTSAVGEHVTNMPVRTINFIEDISNNETANQEQESMEQYTTCIDTSTQTHAQEPVMSNQLFQITKKISDTLQGCMSHANNSDVLSEIKFEFKVTKVSVNHTTGMRESSSTNYEIGISSNSRKAQDENRDINNENRDTNNENRDTNNEVGVADVAKMENGVWSTMRKVVTSFFISEGPSTSNATNQETPKRPTNAPKKRKSTDSPGNQASEPSSKKLKKYTGTISGRPSYRRYRFEEY